MPAPWHPMFPIPRHALRDAELADRLALDALRRGTATAGDLRALRCSLRLGELLSALGYGADHLAALREAQALTDAEAVEHGLAVVAAQVAICPWRVLRPLLARVQAEQTEAAPA